MSKEIKAKEVLIRLENLAEWCFHQGLGWQKNTAQGAIQFINSRPTEPKTKIAEGLKMLAWTKQGDTSLLDLVDDEIILHQPTEKIERNSIDCVLDALLAICDEVENV